MTSQSAHIDLKYGFVIFTTLVSIQLWSFTGMDDSVFDALEVLVVLGLIYFVLLNRVNYRGLVFRNNVLLFLCIPVISSVGAYIFHEQSFHLSLLLLRTNFFWLLYFVLHLFNIPAKKIINLLLFVGLVWVFLTVVQQFTYPVYYFATRDEESTYYFLRAGVYRFMLNGYHYGLFMVLYFFYKFLITRRLNKLFFVFFGLLGFYYYGTRQFAFALLLCMGYTMFLIKGKSRVLAFSSLAAFAILLFFFMDTLFGQYLEMTTHQLENEDEIRLVSAHFFFFEYWPHWLARVIGNGIPHSLSGYGREIDNLKESFGIFRSDVGIIGAFNEFGILYVFNIVWLNIKGLRNKFFSVRTKYLKLIFFNSLLLLFLSEYYANAGVIPFFCFILYLVDKSYADKKEEEEEDEDEADEGEKEKLQEQKEVMV